MSEKCRESLARLDAGQETMEDIYIVCEELLERFHHLTEEELREVTDRPWLWDLWQ